MSNVDAVGATDDCGGEGAAQTSTTGVALFFPPLGAIACNFKHSDNWPLILTTTQLEEFANGCSEDPYNISCTYGPGV